MPFRNPDGGAAIDTSQFQTKPDKWVSAWPVTFTDDEVIHFDNGTHRGIYRYSATAGLIQVA